MMPKNLRNINPALLSLQNSQVFKSEDDQAMSKEQKQQIEMKFRLEKLNR